MPTAQVAHHIAEFSHSSESTSASAPLSHDEVTGSSEDDDDEDDEAEAEAEADGASAAAADSNAECECLYMHYIQHEPSKTMAILSSMHSMMPHTILSFCSILLQIVGVALSCRLDRRAVAHLSRQ